MSPQVHRIRDRALAIARHRRTRKLAIWLVCLVAGFGILFGLVAPPLLRGKVAGELSKKLIAKSPSSKSGSIRSQ
jgi:hypothetical protein